MELAGLEPATSSVRSMIGGVRCYLDLPVSLSATPSDAPITVLLRVERQDLTNCSWPSGPLRVSAVPAAVDRCRRARGPRYAYGGATWFTARERRSVGARGLFQLRRARR